MGNFEGWGAEELERGSVLGRLRLRWGRILRGRGEWCICSVFAVHHVVWYYMYILGMLRHLLFCWENTGLDENCHRLDLYESAATWLGLLPQPRLHVPAYRQVWRP